MYLHLIVINVFKLMLTMVQDQMFIKSMFIFHIHFFFILIFVTDKNIEKYFCFYSVKEGPKALMF